MSRWGNKTKLIMDRAGLALSMIKVQKSGAMVPLVSDLFITTRCNGACRYCYTDKSITAAAELSIEQWLTIIDDLYAMGARMFNLMGGEPLLRSDFPVLLDHIIAKGAVCDVNTNCFLAPRYLDQLQKASQIFTSIDGDEKAHDLNRGPGSFQRTMAGVIAVRKAGIPVRINCTVTSHNVDQIDFLVDLSEQHNLFLTFTPLIRIRENLKSRATDLPLPDDRAKAAFALIKERKKTTRRIMNSDASLDFFLNYPAPLNQIIWRDETGPAADYYNEPCPYGRLQFFVVSNGDVFPCHNMWNEPTFRPKNVVRDGTPAALRQAGDLRCKYCWLANLVEWNEFTSPSWLLKGLGMTLRQALGRR